MASNLFDQFDAREANPFDQFDPGYKAPARGKLRGIGDLGIEVASGLARGVKFTADAFGANNAVSQAAGSVDDFVREYLSAEAKQDDKRIAEIMAAAQDAGVWEQVKAAGEAFLEAPFRTAANAVGTMVPTVATAMIPGAAAAGAARLGMAGTAAAIRGTGLATAGTAANTGMLAGTGALQGAGVVKGAIYGNVSQELSKDGTLSPEEVESRAQEAQSYTGPNADNIAFGALLGGAAGATGVQPLLAKGIGKTLGASVISEGTKQAERGLLAGIGMGVLKETPLEALQGGQEQFAGNVALGREGFDVDPMRGVYGQAALEGLAAAGPGGIAGAFDRGGPAKVAPPSIEDIGKATTVDAAIKAAQDAVAAPVGMLGWNQRYEPEGGFQSEQALYAFADGSVATLDDTVTELSNRAAKDNLEQWFARSPDPMTPEKANDIVAAAAERNVEMLSVPLPDGAGYTVIPKKWADAPVLNDYLEQATAAFQAAQEQRARVEQIQNEPREPRGTLAEPTLIDPKAPNAVAQYVQRMRGVGTPSARAFVQDFEAGRITPQDVLELLVPNKREPTADERLQKAAAQAPKQDDGLLLTADGMPYGTRSAAYVRAKKEGGSVIEVPGGWAVRKDTNEQPDLAGTATGSVGVGDAGRSDAGRGGAPVGRVATDHGRGGEGVAPGAATSSGAPVAVGPELPADPALRVKELSKRWADAVGRGDMQAAVRINDQIVAAKQEAKTAKEAGARAADPTPAAPAAVPGAGATGPDVEADGVTAAAPSPQDLLASLKKIPERIPMTGWSVRQKEATDVLGGRSSVWSVFSADGVELAQGRTKAEAQSLGESLDEPNPEHEKALDALVAARKAELAEAPAAVPAAGTAPVEVGGVTPERVKVMTRFGQNVYVNKSDLDGDKPRMRYFTSTGKSLGVIVRENLDPTGRSRAADAKEQADNPLFNVIGTKDGRVFASESAAARERSMRGLVETHDIAPMGNGFVLKRKEAKAPTPQPEVNAAPAAEPVAEVPAAEPSVNVDRSPAPTNPPAAPQQTRPEQLIELRKRASVLKSLLECLG